MTNFYSLVNTAFPAYADLGSDHSTGSGTIIVEDGFGQFFGSPTSANPLRIVVQSQATPAQFTIYSITDVTGDVLTIGSAIEGTFDQDFAAGDAIVGARVTVGTYTDIHDAVNALETGIVSVDRGGTGVDGSTATDGQLLIGNGTGFSLSSLTAGTNVTITNTAGGIEISAIGGGGSGTVTATGSPVSGNLTTFSGPTSITNGNLSGDVTTSDSLVTTLSDVNLDVGLHGSPTEIPVFAVNAKGLVLAVSEAAVTAPANTLLGTTLASNVVSSSLTSVGTITSGIWHGSIVENTYGGTGLNTSAAANGQILIGNGSGLSLSTITAGSNITVTNSAGGITIAATGGGTPGGTSGQVQYNNGGAFGGFTFGGDATLATSTGVLTLATVNSSPGAFGSSTAIPNITVNAKGLATLVATNPVIAPAGTLSGNTLATTVVTSSLTGVGIITTGTWRGSIVGNAWGGTGLDTSATNDGELLIGNGSGFTLATLTAGTGITVSNNTGSISIDSTVTDYQIFTSSGTWGRPSGASSGGSVRVFGICPGAGGGSGRRDIATTVRGGGGGGAGGNYYDANYRPADLTSSVSVTLGAPGNGGQAQVTDSSNGVNGSQGGVSTFGSYLSVGPALNGSGGTTAGGTAGLASGRGLIIGAAGGAGGIGAAAGAAGAAGGAGAGGGGGGSGLSASNVPQAGGIGGAVNSQFGVTAGGTAGTNPGGNGGNGATLSVSSMTSSPAGGGGGAGASVSTTSAASGGNGGLYGGGGGGGPAITNGGTFSVFRVRVTNPGSGYATPPSVTASAGTETYTASVSGGLIISIAVSGTPSASLTAVPTLTISGGGGSGGAATAMLEGSGGDGGSGVMIIISNP